MDRSTRDFSYDTKRWDFSNLIKSAIQETDLENLHTKTDFVALERKQDQSSPWHRMFYEAFPTIVQETYESFIREVIKPYFGVEYMVYQRIPTFRVHLVNGLGVGEFHKDSDYNHRSFELNCWVPITNAYDTNTVWVESEEDLGDYSPCNVTYGDILVFDGANLRHGNKINQTPTTRVSFDFRIIDRSEWTPTEMKSVHTGKSFDFDDYFSLC